jgi:hypothetical protein
MQGTALTGTFHYSCALCHESHFQGMLLEGPCLCHIRKGHLLWETIELSPVAENEAYHFVFLRTLLTHSMEQRFPLEKPTGSQLLEKFVKIYGTQSFVTPFISAFFLNDS